MIELIILPLTTAMILSIMGAPLGCFVIWRKMSYFGDTIAHASMLGIALGVMLHIRVDIAVVFVCLCLALSISAFKTRYYSADTSLGIWAHGSLALGLLLISTLQNSRINLQAILMGDLLTITYQDLFYALTLCIIILCALMIMWKKLIMATIDQELAQVEGLKPTHAQLLLSVMIALVIALGIKLVGALLISAMLIIPAATARKISSSPEAMAIIACALGVLACASGVALSAFYNFPTGPSIVTSAMMLFFSVSIVVAALSGRSVR